MTTYYAIPCNTATLWTVDGIGRYIKRMREGRGFTQLRLSEESRVDRAYISQIESGRVALPSADLRRRLAAALGVSHLDLLVASGEITEEEISAVGKIGVRPEMTPGSEEIHAMVDQIDWDVVDPGAMAMIKAVLQAAGSQGMATNVRVVDRTDQALESP